MTEDWEKEWISNIPNHFKETSKLIFDQAQKIAAKLWDQMMDESQKEHIKTSTEAELLLSAVCSFILSAGCSSIAEIANQGRAHRWLTMTLDVFQALLSDKGIKVDVQIAWKEEEGDDGKPVNDDRL